MKKIILLLVVIIGCKNNDVEKDKIMLISNEKNVEDTIVKHLKAQELLRLKKNKITEGISGNFDLENDTIYTINRNKITKINIKDYSVVDYKFKSTIFSDNFQNADYLFNLKKINEGFLLSNFNTIAIYNIKSQSVTKKFRQKNIIHSFLDENSSILCDYSGLKLLDKNLTLKDSVDFEFVDNTFVNSSSGFAYFESSEDVFSNFNISNSKIKIGKVKSLDQIVGLTNIDNFFVALRTEKYLIGYYYDNREFVYFIDNETYKVTKKIYIGKEMTPSQQNILEEENSPKLEIINKGNRYYIFGSNSKNELVLLFIELT